MKFKSLFVLVLMQFSLVVQACAELGTWSIPSIIRSGAIESDSQHIDVDPHGNAVAVWTEFFNGHYVVMAATKPFDGGWSPPVVLSAQDNTTVNSTVAVDPNGNAVAVWMGGDSNYVFTVQSASLPAGGVWTSPTTVSSPTSTYDVLDIDVDGAGNFIAVWVQHDDSSEPKMQAAKLPFGGSWTMPVDLTPASNSLFYPTVAVNGAGNAIAAWFRLDNQTGLGIIEAATSISGDSWTVATPVSFFDIPFGFQIIPAAAIDPNGNALVLWIDYNGSNNIVRSASLPFGGIWSVPTQLSEEGADGGDPDVAFNLAGYAVAVWTSSNNGGKNVVQSSNLSFGNSWSEPRMISPNVNDARNPLVSMDPKGNCISIWGDGEDNLQAATQTNQGHWCGGMNIANPFEYHNSCSLAMDNYGNGIAVWRISDASTLVSSSYKVNRIQPPTMVEGKQSHKGVRESGQLVNVIRWKSPLFLNRLNDVVIFHPLNKAQLLQVIEIEIKKVQARLKRREIVIELDDKAKTFLVDKGFQPEMGARPLRRTIEQYLEDPLAEKLLMHPHEGRSCLITVENDKLTFIDQEVFPLGKDRLRVPSPS